MTGTASVKEWLEQAGFPEAELEPRDQLLVVKLPAGPRGRLLGDPRLRASLVELAKNAGFARTALELTDIPPG